MTARGFRDWGDGGLPLIGPDVLSDIIAAAADISLVITDIGRIVSVLANPDHRSFGTLTHWNGRDIRDVLKADSVGKIESRLDRFAAGDVSSRPFELNHFDGSDWEFPVRYTMHRVGEDGAILMLGRDLRPVAEMQQQLVRAQLALERDYERQRDYDTRFRVLMEASPDALAFVSLATSRFTEVNRAAAKVLGGSPAELIGAAVTQELEWQGRQDAEYLAEGGKGDGGPVAVTSRRSGRALTIAPTAFRSAGERAVLLRMTAEPRAGDDIGGVGPALLTLYENGAEAIVFTDRSGGIVAANEAFLNLVDAADTGAVRGHSLADFLSRGAVDLRVLLDNAQRSGRMRLYAARAASLFGAETPVEISATWLEDRLAPAVAFVIRDTSRANDMARSPRPANRSEDRQGARELVGSATLKEIVSETTDVIEKMCIETALELTGNNRVAASEMLGLSRQSLYVKLRKHDLLNWETE